MDQVIIDRFNGANIPRVFHQTQLKDVTGGEGFQSYLLEGDFKTDRSNGIGVNMHGDPRVRAKLFPVAARSLVLMNDNVFYTQMVVIRDVARNEDHPLSEPVMCCNALFIQFFCDPTEESPYNKPDRADIEQLLLTRATHGRRNYFSSMVPLAECSWWTRDFLIGMEGFTKDIQV